VSKFAAFSEHLKAKSVSASGGFVLCPSDQGLCPGPCWGLCPQIPIIGASHLYLGASNSLTPALHFGA